MYVMVIKNTHTKAHHRLFLIFIFLKSVSNIYFSYMEENWCHFLLSWTKQIPSNDSKYQKNSLTGPPMTYHNRNEWLT
jgi:hypothetical protein